MKLLKISIWLFAISTLLAISSCDKIEEGEFLEDTGGKCGQDLPNFPIRKILIEDFTGHKCGNCPDAARIAEALKGVYCDHMVTIAIHMGFFAQTESNSDGSFAYDFNTTMGEELNEFFNIDPTGLPAGMVNRTELNSEIIIGRNKWGTAVGAIVDLAPDMHISISNAYNSVTRTVTTEVTSDFANNLDGTFNMVVVLTEDSIINWQVDYDIPDVNQKNPDYVHRHVLRTSLNGTWGEEIATGAIAAGTSFTKTYETTLPDDWNEDHCAIVAYVRETSSHEIVQVEEVKVK